MSRSRLALLALVSLCSAAGCSGPDLPADASPDGDAQTDAGDVADATNGAFAIASPSVAVVAPPAVPPAAAPPSATGATLAPPALAPPVLAQAMPSAASSTTLTTVVANAPAPATGATAPVDTLAPEASEAFAHVIVEHGLRVVLHSAPDDLANFEQIARGAPVLIARDGAFVVRRGVTTAALPASVQRWIGRTVRVMDERGEVCQATVGRLALIGRVIPHFGTVARWGGRDLNDEPGRRWSRAAIADDVWAQSEGDGHLLTAALVPVRGDCTGGTWARAVALPPVVAAGVADADAALRAEALEQLRALPDYQTAQREYEAQAEGAHAARWEQDEEGRVSVRAVQRPDTHATVVWVSAQTDHGCGEFNASVSGVWHVTTTASGRRVFESLAEGSDVPANAPDSAADLDADGRVEWIHTVDALPVPNHDCNC